MRKILFNIMIITLLTFLVSCSSRKTKKIAILIYDETDTFMQEYLNDVKTKLNDIVEISVSYAEKSQANQNKQFIEYLDKNYDGIIINAFDRLSSITLIEKADEKGVPLIFINREPTKGLEDSVKSYYVGANSRQQGRVQAELVSKMIKDTEIDLDKNKDGIIQIVILKGEQGHQDAEARTSELINGLIELDVNHELVAIEIGGWQKQNGYEIIKQLYNETEFELIISNNDDMALGAIEFLKETEYYLYQEVLPVEIIGVDGTMQGIEAVESGLMYGTVINDYKKQTDYVKILIEYLLYDIKDSKIDYSKKFVLIDGHLFER